MVGSSRTLVFEHALDRHQFDVSSVVLIEICDYATSWTGESELAEHIETKYGVETANATELIRDLLDHGLLVERAGESVPDGMVPFVWSTIGYYDAYVRDWPFMDYSEDDIAAEVSERLESYEENENPPSMIKRYPDAETVALPAHPDHDRLTITQTAPASTAQVDTAYRIAGSSDGDVLGAFADTFEKPSTEADDSCTRDTLSKLLLYTFGKIGSIENEDIPHGPLVLKSSPGHGSLHPIEAYPIIRGIEAVPDGTYHYSVADHALERLSDVPARLDNEFPESGGTVIPLTAVVERCMWKYRGARDIRNILHDLGHLFGTYSLVTTALGLSGGIRQQFAPAEVCDEIGVNLYDEPVVGVLTAE